MGVYHTRIPYMKHKSTGLHGDTVTNHDDPMLLLPFRFRPPFQFVSSLHITVGTRKITRLVKPARASKSMRQGFRFAELGAE